MDFVTKFIDILKSMGDNWVLYTVLIVVANFFIALFFCSRNFWRFSIKFAWLVAIVLCIIEALVALLIF